MPPVLQYETLRTRLQTALCNSQPSAETPHVPAHALAASPLASAAQPLLLPPWRGPAGTPGPPEPPAQPSASAPPCPPAAGFTIQVPFCPVHGFSWPSRADVPAPSAAPSPSNAFCPRPGLPAPREAQTKGENPARAEAAKRFYAGARAG